MSTTNVNKRSSAVKRILREIKEIRELMESEPDTTPFACDVLETDIYEWCFALRGPPQTEFEGGIYHGRILLPPDYPFKPPSFIMLTPSGRFEVHTKICLSISSYHPEHWQPSWSMRTALMALIAFFPTCGRGAVGSLDAPPNERKQMAAESRSKIPQVSSDERMEIMERLHQYLLRQKLDAPSPGVPPPSVAPNVQAEPPSGAIAEHRQIQQAVSIRTSTLGDRYSLGGSSFFVNTLKKLASILDIAIFLVLQLLVVYLVAHAGWF